VYPLPSTVEMLTALVNARPKLALVPFDPSPEFEYSPKYVLSVLGSELDQTDHPAALITFVIVVLWNTTLA